MRSGLDSHMKSQHADQHRCLECQWSFKTKEKFKEHIEYIHRDYDDTKRDSETDTDDNENNGEESYSEKEKPTHRVMKNL